MLWLLPVLPIAGGAVLLLSGPRSRGIAGWLATLLATITLGLVLWAWAERPVTHLTWLSYTDGALSLSLSAEGAAAPLATMVAAMALVIFVYGHGYMRRDGARARFFGFMALFLGSMELVVLSDDLLSLLIGWELVSMCSYALIGFWYLEQQRVVAANRAFITTRSADVGLYLATAAAFAGLGDLQFQALNNLTPPLSHLVAMGLIMAALGKSAQLPFSGWVSGAMQGPTPVSALIHAATMVAAGAILLIKSQPLLEVVPWASVTILNITWWAH